MKTTTAHRAARLTVLIAATAVAALAGCASNLVGYSAETAHTCTRDEGVGCTPVSDVYKMAMAGKLPGQTGSTKDSNGQAAAVLQNLASAAQRPAMSSGLPVRTAPRVLRIWYAPWRDGLDVLHDQRHSYLTLDTGRWLIEHNQERLMREFGPTRLLQGSSADGASSAPNAQTARQPRSAIAGSNSVLPPLPALPTQQGAR